MQGGRKTEVNAVLTLWIEVEIRPQTESLTKDTSLTCLLLLMSHRQDRKSKFISLKRSVRKSSVSEQVFFTTPVNYHYYIRQRVWQVNQTRALITVIHNDVFVSGVSAVHSCAHNIPTCAIVVFICCYPTVHTGWL